MLRNLTSASYTPCCTLLFEWYYARRGMAMGIMYAGSGAGGVIYPLLVNYLLKTIGYRATMVGLGIVLIIVGNLCLIFVKRRVPIQGHERGQRRMPAINWTFLQRRTFWSAVMTVLITSLGNFIPSLWLPSKSKAFSASIYNFT